jgi:sulfonate transport system ATP-binding protein
MTKPYIQVKGVSRRFGEKSVLHDIDLDIQFGEFVAVVGKSGSGKSTLLRLLAGLDNPDTGEIIVDARELRGLNQDARVMFQDARLLPWKRVLQNVGLGLQKDWTGAALEVLRQVQLIDRTHDWTTILSGGEKQRVALARALVRRPPLLLLDEPLGALDALTRIEMQELIENLWHQHGFTALLITHDVEEAVALADRVLLLQDGGIALDLKIDLPRPRRRGSVEFAQLSEYLLQRVLNKEIEPVKEKVTFKFYRAWI